MKVQPTCQTIKIQNLLMKYSFLIIKASNKLSDRIRSTHPHPTHKNTDKTSIWKLKANDLLDKVLKVH